MKQRKQSLAVITKQGTIRVGLSEILYLEKELRIICVHTRTMVYRYYGTFKNLPECLDRRFCRCHNSFFVNLEKVRVIRRYELELDNGEMIKISQRYYPATRHTYRTFIMSEEEIKP